MGEATKFRVVSMRLIVMLLKLDALEGGCSEISGSSRRNEHIWDVDSGKVYWVAFCGRTSLRFDMVNDRSVWLQNYGEVQADDDPEFLSGGVWESQDRHCF